MRTSPHSNIRRACFRWSSWSGSDDSSIRATSSTRLRTLSALSAFTRLRSPRRLLQVALPPKLYVNLSRRVLRFKPLLGLAGYRHGAAT